MLLGVTVKNCQSADTTFSTSSRRKSDAMRAFTRKAYDSAQIRRIALKTINPATVRIKLTNVGVIPAMEKTSKIARRGAGVSDMSVANIIWTTRTRDMMPTPSEILAISIPKKIPKVSVLYLKRKNLKMSQREEFINDTNSNDCLSIAI